MSKQDNLSDFLVDIADAIREKKGTTNEINAQDFADEIKSIEGGDNNFEKIEYLAENLKYLRPSFKNIYIIKIEKDLTPTTSFIIMGTNNKILLGVRIEKNSFNINTLSYNCLLLVKESASKAVDLLEGANLIISNGHSQYSTFTFSLSKINDLFISSEKIEIHPYFNKSFKINQWNSNITLSNQIPFYKIFNLGLNQNDKIFIYDWTGDGDWHIYKILPETTITYNSDINIYIAQEQNARIANLSSYDIYTDTFSWSSGNATIRLERFKYATDNIVDSNSGRIIFNKNMNIEDLL